MQTRTRLLLPFTEGINASALSYAIQLAEQYGATLVPLALIPTKQGKEPRLELIEQAQDFLMLAQRKAERQGVLVQTAQIYTRNVARSIEAFASEMDCEAVILFMGNASEILLGHAEVYTLMQHLACNIHMVLLSEKSERKLSSNPPHTDLFAIMAKPSTTRV